LRSSSNAEACPSAGKGNFSGGTFGDILKEKSAKKGLTDFVYCVSRQGLNHKFVVYKVFRRVMTEQSQKTEKICENNWCKLLFAINLHFLQKPKC